MGDTKPLMKRVSVPYAVVCSMLSPSNYTIWAKRMKVLLRVHKFSTIKFIIEIKMVASRIVEFPEDLVEEIDVIKGWVEETTTVRYLAGVRGDVRGDLLLPDTDQRDRMVLAGDRCWETNVSHTKAVSDPGKFSNRESLSKQQPPCYARGRPARMVMIVEEEGAIPSRVGSDHELMLLSRLRKRLPGALTVLTIQGRDKLYRMMSLQRRR
ncbi:hypothetical protein F2Q70_00029196 [Brassica cretica]|uniref:DUF4219 domain-containing protein n=1 Tax=Brassica cretica TaxID=69181 RepID=A0A8S9FEK8_BRACR|nr:hypothetical protein F2Q70_00029196 [Brassica cretica]